MTAEVNQDIQACLRGERLFGDDFDLDQLRRWYKEEEAGYAGIENTDLSDDAYGYHALNHWHFWRFARSQGRAYPHCLSLGGARGDDVEPLAPLIDRFTVIEPFEGFWTPQIGGKPAVYMRPEISGEIPLETSSIHLVTSLGVLHHVANVSRVMQEIGRVLAGDGLLVLREPIHSMGDWRKPRRGLTCNERGIPVQLLREYLDAAGLEPLSIRYCMFGPFGRLRAKRAFSNLWNTGWMMPVDQLFSALFAWNDVYSRTNFFKKCAPGCVSIIARRRE